MGDETVADLASQLERTAMAWQRTTLALAVTGALLLRFAATEQVLLWPAGVAVLLLAGGACVDEPTPWPGRAPGGGCGVGGELLRRTAHGVAGSVAAGVAALSVAPATRFRGASGISSAHCRQDRWGA